LLACGDRQLVGCVRASNSVAEVSGRRRAQRSVLPVAKGVRGRGPNSWDFARDSAGAKTSTTGTVVAKPWRRGRPTPGVRKGIAGAEVFARWKALQAVSLVVRSRGRLGGGLGGSHEPVTRERSESVGEATGVSEARRARITTGRQRPSRRSTRTKRGRAARRSESHCRGTGGSSIALARKRSMQENQRCAGTGTKK